MDVLNRSASLRGPLELVRRRRVAVVLAAIVLLLALLVVRGLHRHRVAAEQAEQQDQANSIVAVSVAKVTSGDIQVRIPALLGTITPLATVTVKTQISGQLQKIGFREGQLVKQGEFLAQIDPRPYQAALDQSRGNLRRDEAQLKDARLDLNRYEDLIKEDAVSGQQLDQQRALVEQYEGTVESDKAQVSAAEVNLAYTHIVSPVTGRVGLRQVDAGNYVTPADVNGIVVITQLQPITAIFPVPEDNVSDISRRLNSGATLPVEAYDRSNAKKLAVGKLLTIDNQIDTTTGTVKLRALFDNADGALFPNQFVNVQLLENTLSGQIVMPNAAVHHGAPNGLVSTFVYLVKPDSTVAVRPVTLGVLDGEQVQVTSGLAVGDVVVTEGGDRLRDGAAVLLPGAKPPPPSTSGNAWQRGANGASKSGSWSHRGTRHP
ncbi:MAG TPA: efflux RND transporter periplasmic adaptor subunit [Steroidobacteraceae bacterium]|nr:efflux RND transporter periplasmic adaptor subunit [Steroidobacteraceae bacterium]